ncbi:phage tail length tape measure family protein [Novosphingobium piscinae]|uniref:Phage tail length tape measure family protein n=1 Tax=Novosphingobium piscinae TaxID=1507448 RepID=A0A7X1KQD4_9SPHN|nr:phage tail length tape measure family protein [Novosphingobium piscinae]MBC2669657.1 phage tail length tape measure family protein [Novosphingobium piscinae]
MRYKDDGSAKSAFLRDVDQALGSAESRFAAFSGEAQKQLDRALSMPRTAGGSLDLGAAAARAAAQAAQARAIAAREIATATAAAARAEGDYSQQARLATAAADALAVESEQAARAAKAHADALAQVQRELDRTASATDAVIVGGKRLVAANDQGAVSAGQHRAAMQQLAWQIGDVTQGLAMGISPLTIFAQQSGQVVQALSLARGGATGLLGFLASPWGAVITGAAMIAGQFAGKLLESGEAAETAADKYLTAADAARQLAGAQNSLRYVERSMQRNALVEEQLALENLIARKPGASDPNAMPWNRTYGLDGAKRRLAEVKQALLPLNNELRLADEISDKLAKSSEQAARGTARHGGAARTAAPALSAYSRALASVAAAYDRMNEGNAWGSASLAGRIEAMAAATDPAKIIGAPAAESVTVWDAIKSANEGALAAMGDLATATGRWNAELDVAADRLAATGRMGADLAAVSRALRGNFAGIGGAAGVALSTVFAAPAGRNADGSIARLGDRIEAIFAERGAFGQTMTTILQGAGSGLAVGSVIFGQNNGSAQLGGAIGGALGQSVGDKIGAKVTGALGKALGPLGAIAGGLLGGLVGGIFSSRPRGSGTVTQDGVTASANNGAVKATLDSFGLGLQQAITKIATQLGGRVGSYDVGIGSYRGGYYQVAASGSDQFLGQAQYSAKSGQALYDGLDATAALRAAISNAIQDGAIQGVRASTQTLLKAGKDIEAQLSKAISFEGVFTRLKENTDPVGAALDTLNKQFSDLKDVFAEAGASAEEYADLEKLYGIERSKAIKTAFDQVSGSLKSLLDDLGINNTARSLRERESLARAALDPLSARVDAGDTSAFGDYAQASRTYLDIARQLYGSQAGFFSAQDAISGRARSALDRQLAIAEVATSRDSPFSTGTRASDSASVESAINRQTDALLAAQQGANDNLAQILLTLRSQSTGSALPAAAGGYW